MADKREQTRSIQECKETAFSIDVSKLETDVSKWLLEQVKAKEYSALKLCWLLAHADDGVIWGRVENEQLESVQLLTSADSSKSFLPSLRRETLRDARLFSKEGELKLWRTAENTFAASLTCENSKLETPGESIESYSEALDEDWLLWGSEDGGEALPNNFTLWTEGKRGLRHAVPLATTARPPLLRVRHYLADDDCARFAGARLLDLVPAN